MLFSKGWQWMNRFLLLTWCAAVVLCLGQFNCLSLQAASEARDNGQGNQNQNEKIAPAKLPKKVVAAVKTKFPGARLIGAKKYEGLAGTQYFIRLRYKKRKYEVFVQRNAIFQIRKPISKDELPEAVIRAVEARYPRATYARVTEVKILKAFTELRPAGKKYYEVSIKHRSMTSTVERKFAGVISPKGKILSPFTTAWPKSR
jgi:hypothetical protein